MPHPLPPGAETGHVRGSKTIHVWRPAVDRMRFSLCNRPKPAGQIVTVHAAPTCLNCLKAIERERVQLPEAPYKPGLAPVSVLPGLKARLYVGDNREAWPVSPFSVHLVFGSPVYYGAGHRIEYGPEVPIPETVDAWEADLYAVLTRAKLALVDGGRIVLNVANSGRKPYTDLAGRAGALMAEAGFVPRGQIIWDKGRGIAGTAWGSWKLASAPVIRDHHEYLIVGQKGNDKMDVRGFPARTDWLPGEFEASTLSVWPIPPETRNPHPAPFPLALALRVVRLYTHPGMAVFDPWMGSGTTALAALQAGCHAYGLDVSRAYVEAAGLRLTQAVRQWCPEPAPLPQKPAVLGA